MSTTQEAKWHSLSSMISHIEQSHHAFTREALAHIGKILSSPATAGIETGIRSSFEKLQADLTPHLMKEERVLFPYIVALESHPEQLSDSCFGSIANPIRMMGIEHQGVMEILKELRELTANYQPQPGGGANVAALYAALEELDRDLVEHVRLENDVLFPQALALERNTQNPAA